MKNMHSVILLAVALVVCCFLPASSLLQDPHSPAQIAKANTFLFDQTWNFSYSFPAPPHSPSLVKGSFRFVLNDHQIEGYEDDGGRSHLVLRGTLRQDSSNISWKVNFGAAGGQNDSSAGQHLWDCAKHTRFGQWIPTSLSISRDKKTISFQYPILEAGSNGSKMEHCREVSVLYRITLAHHFL